MKSTFSICLLYFFLIAPCSCIREKSAQDYEEFSVCLKETSPEVHHFLENVHERIVKVYGQDQMKILKMAVEEKVDIDLTDIWNGSQTMDIVHQLPGGIKTMYTCVDRLPLTSRQKEELFEILTMHRRRDIDFNLVERLSREYSDSYIERYFYAYLISYYVMQSQIWDKLPAPPAW